MKALVTGVAGQLGHDIMKELEVRGITGIGSDLAPAYSGMAADSVASMPYVQLDITDRQAVQQVLQSVQPDVLIHCDQRRGNPLLGRSCQGSWCQDAVYQHRLCF